MGNAADTKAPSIGRPWRRATGWLVALTVFFYLTYGVSNWLASQRGDVPAIVSWVVGPFVTGIPRDSLSLMVTSARTALVK